MILKYWVAAALGMAIGAAMAADIRCNPAGSQMEMNACAADDLRKADAELNATWQALLRKEANDKVFIAKLRTAQKAWLAFRDAELAAYFACEDENERMCWGSMYPMSYNSRKTDLTRERTRTLKDMLENGRVP
ncbi:uncharacterized protein YecT (DUF1311 family) [Pseudoduganella flava]|uniref:DUF1311 domain-containing protein n=1 Tax=Pseudoduganella flava TaxID=871742 RepID=A0A562PF19_9BURK|nr:lysozyme inhibitor LprI family protein [Pseudoduganella flava]QGZ38939.1 DUF1311 domain-containing protein [Pseudoduganella flava]TWI43021.1 uncharacterized protein YecT (DUF1311 family) [Pseudoduganella flava]